MGFVEAVQSGFAHYADFGGRASRAAYWWWVLFVLLVSLAAAGVDVAIGSPWATQDGWRGFLGVVSGVAALALLLPLLINLIPVVGGLVLLVFMLSAGTPGDNRYGSPPR